MISLHDQMAFDKRKLLLVATLLSSFYLFASWKHWVYAEDRQQQIRNIEQQFNTVNQKIPNTHFISQKSPSFPEEREQAKREVDFESLQRSLLPTTEWKNHIQQAQKKNAYVIPEMITAGKFHFRWEKDPHMERYFMLAGLDSFLVANEFEYYLSHSGLLGCVRHMEPVPFDDEIDIIVPTHEFERLRSLDKGNLHIDNVQLTLDLALALAGYYIGTWGHGNKIYPETSLFNPDMSRKKSRKWPFLNVWKVTIEVGKLISPLQSAEYQYQDAYPVKRAFCNTNLLLRVPYDVNKVLNVEGKSKPLENCVAKSEPKAAVKPCSELSSMYYFRPKFESYKDGRVVLIPPIIHQIVAEDNITPHPSCQHMYKGWEFMVWGPSRLKQYNVTLVDDAERDTLDYNDLVFTVLYLYGGIYIPNEMACKYPVDELLQKGNVYMITNDLECVYEAEVCVMGSTPGHFIPRLVNRLQLDEARKSLKMVARIFDLNKYFA